MNKYLKISRASYIITLCLIPLVVSPLSLTPYTLIKTVFLSSGILISLFFYLISKPKSLKIPSEIYMILLITELPNWLLNTEFSFFPRYSEGLPVSFLVFLFVFLGINLFNKVDYEKIIIYSSFPVIIVSLIDITNANTRASGTLGQANFLGIFIVLTSLSIINRFKEFPDKIQKYFLVYFLLLGILFVKSASLTSLIALFLGMFIIRKKISIKPKTTLVITISISILLLIFGGIYISKLQDTYNQIFHPKQTIISDSFLIRKVIWYETLNLLRKNPSKLIFGFGPNSFDYYFEKVRENKFENYSERYLLFDKPHNYYLEIIFSFGIIYFITFIFAVYRVLKNNIETRFLIIPVLFFLFFNWLDIYLKVLLFSLIFSNLNTFNIRKYFILFPFIIFSFSIFILFFNLFYKDTNFYLGNSNYVLSHLKDEIVNLKYKNPVLLLEARRHITEKDEIKNFLLNEFKNNNAVLFQLN